MLQRQSSLTTATHWPVRSIGADSRGGPGGGGGGPKGCARATGAPSSTAASTAAAGRADRSRLPSVTQPLHVFGQRRFRSAPRRLERQAVLLGELANERIA